MLCHSAGFQYDSFSKVTCKESYSLADTGDVFPSTTPG
jgi:hypothetical protein